MHRSPSCSINDLWTDLVIEPLTGNSHDKCDGRNAFAAEGLAHPTTFGSLLQWVRKAEY